MPDGYVKKQVAEKEILQLQQEYLYVAAVLRKENEEITRQGMTQQQVRYKLAERTAMLERENEQRRQAEHVLRQELGDARELAETTRSVIISEGRAAIHRAEESTEARAEERHTLWRLNAKHTLGRHAKSEP